ncbi:MAG: tripartite tricarboxylate transporter permease [archaeon]|nr:tripartite tricarboxylate transporter permease [archaeon]
MLLEIVLFLILGVLIGTFTGLTPGIHINLVGTALISGAFSILTGINSIYLIVFIVSMSITHVFIDFIPSIFLGAPEDGTELSVLPGHEMLKRGQGFHAVKLTSLGCLYGLFIFVLLIAPLYFLSTFLKSLPEIIIAIGLIAISLNMILLEEKKFSALFVFLLTGILGFIVFGMELNEPLLPLLTGLFGSAGIFFSIRQKTKIEKQKTESIEKVDIKKEKKLLLSSAIFSPLSMFLPALSSGQIAIVSSQFAKPDKKSFLFLLGTTTMLTMCLSFLGLFLISKTRTGSSAAIKELIGIPNIQVFILIIFVILISGFISFFLVNKISKKFLEVLEKINYSKVSITILLIMVIVTFLVSGIWGFFVLVVSTLTGIYCISSGVKRTTMIGCLIIPTILFYLGFG